MIWCKGVFEYKLTQAASDAFTLPLRWLSSGEIDTADGPSRCGHSRCSVTQTKPYKEVLTTKVLYARL